MSITEIRSEDVDAHLSSEPSELKADFEPRKLAHRFLHAWPCER
jgi:hypothetical protein